MPALFSHGTCAATTVTASVSKNYAVQDLRREVRKHSRFPVSWIWSASAKLTLLCSVMLLDKRFARPHADLHHRPKSDWSCIRRQGHDSRDRFRDCLDNASCSHSASGAYVPPSAESSKDSSVLQLVSCFCRHRASRSVGTSRQASPCTDRPVSETRGAIPLSGLSLHHAILAHTLSDAALTPPLTAASGDPNCTARLPLVVLSSPPVQSPSDLSRPEVRPLL